VEEDETDDSIDVAGNRNDHSVSSTAATLTSNSNTTLDMSLNLAAYVGRRGIPMMQTGCHSAVQGVDDAVESAVNLWIPSNKCVSCSNEEGRFMRARTRQQDGQTIEVDYDGDLHTIVASSPSKSGLYDEIILVRNQETKEKTRRFRSMGRWFGQKSKQKHLDDSPEIPPSSPERQTSSRAAAVKGQYSPTSTVDSSPQRLQQQSRSPPRNKSSWWGGKKNKPPAHYALETRRYVHEEEEAIQEGNKNVLMIRMHRTPTACMLPQQR
jgi:hypothetical protein